MAALDNEEPDVSHFPEVYTTNLNHKLGQIFRLLSSVTKHTVTLTAFGLMVHNDR